jgi:hypothetical protein
MRSANDRNIAMPHPPNIAGSRLVTPLAYNVGHKVAISRCATGKTYLHQHLLRDLARRNMSASGLRDDQDVARAQQ